MGHDWKMVNTEMGKVKYEVGTEHPEVVDLLRQVRHSQQWRSQKLTCSRASRKVDGHLANSVQRCPQFTHKACRVSVPCTTLHLTSTLLDHCIHTAHTAAQLLHVPRQLFRRSVRVKERQHRRFRHVPIHTECILGAQCTV